MSLMSNKQAWTWPDELDALNAYFAVLWNSGYTFQMCPLRRKGKRKTSQPAAARMRPAIEAGLSPILRPVMDVQDFDGSSLHRIDHDIGERRKREFSCTAAVARPAAVR